MGCAEQLIIKAFLTKALLNQNLALPSPTSPFAMKTVSISVGILLSLFLLVNFCYAIEENVAALQPGQGADITKNGEAQEEKFKFLPHHKPLYKKPFFKPVPHPIVKKPIPHHPILKKPFPKPHYPPVFSSHP